MFKTVILLLFVSSLIVKSLGVPVKEHPENLLTKPGILDIIKNKISSPSFTQVGPYFLSSTDFPWYEAKWYCETAGMRLLSIETPQQNNEVLGLLGSAGVDLIWTSGTDEAFESQFIWATTGSPFNYNNFIGTPPIDTTQNCVYLGTSKFWTNYNYPAAGWAVAACTISLRFVCE